MNTEQIKSLLEVFALVGTAGKEAFIWWLLAEKVLPAVAWLLVFVGFMWVAHKLIWTSSGFAKLRELRDALGVGAPGYMRDCELVETLDKAIELARAKKP